VKFSRVKMEEDEDLIPKKLVRRMRHCAKAREDSTRLLSMRFLQRDIVKSSLNRETENNALALALNRRLSEDRWAKKLAKSPYNCDQLAQAEKALEENKILDLIKSRKKTIEKNRKADAETKIIQHGLSERDELAILREQKRSLLNKEKELRAIRDIGKTAARTAKVEADNRNRLLERQQKILQQRLRSDDLYVPEYTGFVQ